MKKTLQKLINEGFEHFGSQGANEVYKKGDDLKLYSPYIDKVLCSWDLKDLMDGLGQ